MLWCLAHLKLALALRRSEIWIIMMAPGLHCYLKVHDTRLKTRTSSWDRRYRKMTARANDQRWRCARKHQVSKGNKFWLKTMSWANLRGEPSAILDYSPSVVLVLLLKMTMMKNALDALSSEVTIVLWSVSDSGLTKERFKLFNQFLQSITSITFFSLFI